MKNIGCGKCVIAVISKNYLQSDNCMFELLEMFKHNEFSDRIFPIVLPETRIYDSIDRIEYIKYWEEKRDKLNEAMRSVDSANLHGIREEIDLYTEIRAIFPELINIIQDMNTSTTKIYTESEFAPMIQAVERKLKE